MIGSTIFLFGRCPRIFITRFAQMMTLCIWGLLYAQNISIELELAPQQIYYGENSKLVVKVNGADSAEVDTTPLQKDFIVQLRNASPRHESYTEIINGEMKTYSFQGYYLVYDISPRRAGNLTVGPLAIEVDGKTYNSNQVTLSVVGAATTGHDFIRISSPHQQYILGEIFSVLLEIYLEEDKSFIPGRPPHLSVPWLTEQIEGLQMAASLNEILQPYVVDTRQPGMRINRFVRRSFFDDVALVFALPSRRLRQKSPRGEEQSYLCYTLQMEFEAKKLGNYTFGPVLLKGIIANDNTAERIVLSGDSCAIAVVEPPLVGRPASFSGAIGEFSIKAQLKKSDAYVGDPMTLLLIVEGKGSLDEIAAPKLGEQAQLTKYFSVYDDMVNSKIEDNRKIFTYTIRPKTHEIGQIPSIEFAYYDTQKRQYQIARSEAIAVKIKPVERGESLPTEQKTPPKILHSGDTGIAANYEGIDGVATQQTRTEFWYTAIFIALPLCYFILLAGVIYQRTFGSDIAYQRRRNALSRCQQRIARASTETPQEFYSEMALALTGYVADRFNLPEQSLVSGELISKLQSAGVTDKLIGEIGEFLSLCESVQYGAAAIESQNIQDSVRRMVAQLEREL